MTNTHINYHPGKLTRFLRKLAWFFTVYLPPERNVTIPTRNGILTFNSKDKTTGRNLYIRREHEFDEMTGYVSLLRKEGFLSKSKGKVVLDVGGYIGMSSTAFLLENLFEKAIAFEPSPGNYHLLEKNIINNHLEDRLIAHNIALSDCDARLDFELSEKNYGDHRIRVEGNTQPDAFNEAGRQVISIKACRFDDLDDRQLGASKDNIELIWMDIQGHEARFIKGASEFIRKHPAVPVIMEFWPYAIKRSGVSKQEFIDIVSALFSGYFVSVGGKFIYYAMSSIGAFFDEQDAPGKGSTIVLCNKTKTQ